MSGFAVPAAGLDVHILDVDMGSGKVLLALSAVGPLPAQAGVGADNRAVQLAGRGYRLSHLRKGPQ